MAEATLLPGEGEMRTQVRVRRECENCGTTATLRIGFLLDNYRRNPASRAYGRDDCTWITDAEAFACEACKRTVERRAGYEAVAWWTLSHRTAHMFLTWEVARG